MAKACKPPVVMTIAGSDPSGGAGIQADLKTIASLGCYGTSAITALTAQNTTGVQGVFPCSPEFVGKQITSVLEDIEIDSFKTGMLVDSNVVRAVANALRSFYASRSTSTIPPVVVDPVCVSTSGHSLLEPFAVRELVTEIFPLSTLITPNKLEAEHILTQMTGDKTISINSVEQAFSAAMQLSKLSGAAVLLKGGHLVAPLSDIQELLKMSTDMTICDGNDFQANTEILQVNKLRASADTFVIDILVEPDLKRCTVYYRPKIITKSTHGTGCTLSSAIACYLSQGHRLQEAIQLGIAYTHLGIENSYPLGSGHGPLNHLHSSITRITPLPSPLDRFPLTRSLINSNADVWQQYVRHPFVQQLGRGILNRECFMHFIKQDYKYLQYYARAYGLLIAKEDSFSGISSSLRTIQNVVDEVSMHKTYCEEWGISEQELVSTPESAATTAYGAFILDTGLRGDTTSLIMALSACLLGYGEVGLWLKSEAKLANSWVQLEGNPYLKWIEDYSGDHYQNAVKLGLELIENQATMYPPNEKQYSQWKEIWGRCTQLEKGFWDMALNLS